MADNVMQCSSALQAEESLQSVNIDHCRLLSLHREPQLVDEVLRVDDPARYQIRVDLLLKDLVSLEDVAEI